MYSIIIHLFYLFILTSHSQETASFLVEKLTCLIIHWASSNKKAWISLYVISDIAINGEIEIPLSLLKSVELLKLTPLAALYDGSCSIKMIVIKDCDNCICHCSCLIPWIKRLCVGYSEKLDGQR
jgi:hypothetical protein